MSLWRPIPPPPLWKRWLPEWSHGPIRLLFSLSLLGAVVGLGFVFFYFILAMRFDLEEVRKVPSMTFYDRKGVEITAPGSGGRKLVKRAEIPDFLVKSLRAREDARFFEHIGVDVRGLLRATVRNLKDGNMTQGASTLSMQLARNSFNIKQKSLHRKFLEIALTLRIEARYSKDEILTQYLNRIYFGAGAEGIEQASRIYFGKTTSELTDGECALIVGIIRGPHIFSPIRNLDAALRERRTTLDRMVKMGFIDQARRDEIAEEPVKLVRPQDRLTQTSYALQAVERELDFILEGTNVNVSGLEIITTLDSKWQKRLEMELTHAVEDLEDESTWKHPTPSQHQAGKEPAYVQYAAVTSETRTGAVLALIGGRNFSHSRFDRSRSRRDLGSAFEPFVAAAAAERGKLVLPGKPVQTGRQIGPAEVRRLAERCGFGGIVFDTEDVFRGSVSASAMEMSIGLATLGNQGKKPRPFFIREIKDANGEVIYQAKSQFSSALSPSAAEDAMSVLKRTSGTRNFTGATGSERDAWTLRLGPTGSTAIWIGFDSPKAIAKEQRLKSLLDEFVKRLGNS